MNTTRLTIGILLVVALLFWAIVPRAQEAAPPEAHIWLLAYHVDNRDYTTALRLVKVQVGSERTCYLVASSGSGVSMVPTTACN